MSPYRVAADVRETCDHPGPCDWFCSPLKRALVGTLIVVIGGVLGVLFTMAAGHLISSIEALR